MANVKAYVVSGLGIGCHEEAAHAYKKAGADAEVIHIRQLLTGGKDFLFKSQILNLSGGFLHGDILGAGMCAANELEHSGIKDAMIEYAENGRVIYGQCNGFQLLAKTGLLPGMDDDFSRQTVTLTDNDCGSYRVAPVLHGFDWASGWNHFAFKGLADQPFYLWCRHGEGKLQFYSPFGTISEDDAKRNRAKVNSSHVILRYVSLETLQQTEDFPHNPNGSVDGIAGLASLNRNIFGHMAHTEVGIYRSRDPRWFAEKDRLRRQGVKASDLDEKRLEDICLQIFRDIVNHVR